MTIYFKIIDCLGNIVWVKANGYPYQKCSPHVVYNGQNAVMKQSYDSDYIESNRNAIERKQWIDIRSIKQKEPIWFD